MSILLLLKTSCLSELLRLGMSPESFLFSGISSLACKENMFRVINYRNWMLRVVAEIKKLQTCSLDKWLKDRVCYDSYSMALLKELFTDQYN